MSVLVFVSLGLPREYSQRLGGASASKFSGGMYILFFYLFVYYFKMILLPNYQGFIKSSIFMAYIDQEQNEARFCALRWATSLYNSQHCPSLYICMLSAADPKLDIRY